LVDMLAVINKIAIRLRYTHHQMLPEHDY
jgi:hypothetical protein